MRKSRLFETRLYFGDLLVATYPSAQAFRRACLTLAFEATLFRAERGTSLLALLWYKIKLS